MYIVSNTILQAITFSQNGLTFKPIPLNFYALEKGQTLSKSILSFSENHAVFFSFPVKMACFLVRKYSEHDVQVTSILNVQSTFWHNVEPTVMIHHTQNHTSKRRWDSTLKELLYLYVIWTFENGNEEEGRSVLCTKKYVNAT